jgi:hypothetical protein
METDLAAATALISANDCEVLPVLTEAGELAGMVPDRDSCSALAKRNCRPSELTDRDVITASPFSSLCPDDIRLELRLVGSGEAGRSSVITEYWLG